MLPGRWSIKRPCFCLVSSHCGLPSSAHYRFSRASTRALKHRFEVLLLLGDAEAPLSPLVFLFTLHSSLFFAFNKHLFSLIVFESLQNLLAFLLLPSTTWAPTVGWQKDTLVLYGNHVPTTTTTHFSGSYQF